MVGCVQPESPELKAAKVSEEARRESGPKRGPGCYKVINKKLRLYGCTFQSTQGSIFTTSYGQGPGYRDHTERGDALSSPANWHLIFNRKIRCLYDDPGFVAYGDVKPIKCPEYLYHN